MCLPEPIIEEIHWDQGTPINISVVEDRLVIDGHIEEERMTLEYLLAGITAENCHHEIVPGIPVGNADGKSVSASPTLQGFAKLLDDEKWIARAFVP